MSFKLFFLTLFLHNYIELYTFRVLMFINFYTSKDGRIHIDTHNIYVHII